MSDITRSKEIRNDDGTSTWAETQTFPDIVRTRTVTASAWAETRITCFCCSCPETGSSDPYCRNHGFAGTRPCEKHDMPGDADEDGVMPASVQSRRNQITT